ncbi:hypothetical protein cyc_01053 [Cyclospora cayetanensis]|uniref:Uncharacterized protein n=1 Tax=Cyclospora cayetanensis TaxID=88456 RepID=A0A1D3CZW6_9EIME|nr:hypothetical protein cyc_01053 [Cyclospora cayetanensis]
MKSEALVRAVVPGRVGGRLCVSSNSKKPPLTPLSPPSSPSSPSRADQAAAAPSALFVAKGRENAAAATLRLQK